MQDIFKKDCLLKENAQSKGEKTRWPRENPQDKEGKENPGHITKVKCHLSQPQTGLQAKRCGVGRRPAQAAAGTYAAARG